MSEEKQSPYIVPISIVVAGILIAAAIMYSGGPSSRTVANVGEGVNPPTGGPQPSASLDAIKPVSADDHILGNPDAPVKIVEFSDLECPFCKRFHETLQQVMDEYGKDGQVAWVYRHFPLVQLHSKAPKEAEATECAAELGGNTAFWAFTDKVFEATPSNDGLDLALLPQFAEAVGVDKAAFQTCLDSGRHAAFVQSQYDDALASGGNGTPYSVVIAANGKKFPINGALPYAQVKAVIDQALKEK